MIPPPILKQIGDELLAAAMAAPISGETKEQKMRSLLKALRPYFKTVSTHSLTAMYVEALLKFRAAVRFYGRNKIHLRGDMGTTSPFPLSFDQVTNFSKLRMFGLAVHADKTNSRSGLWLLTERGNDFLNGKIVIPRKVYTFQGHPIHPKELIPGQRLVHIKEYKQELPSFETYYDFVPPPRVSTPAQTIKLF